MTKTERKKLEQALENILRNARYVRNVTPPRLGAVRGFDGVPVSTIIHEFAMLGISTDYQDPDDLERLVKSSTYAIPSKRKTR